MSRGQRCSMCERAKATTNWGFPVCRPCSEWLDKLHVQLQAEFPPPDTTPSYRERARRAIAARRLS